VAELTLLLRNSFDELPRLAESATAFLEDHEASPEVVFAINLALEELITNIVKYGYDDEGEHEIFVRLARREGAVELEIRDDGHVFNPFDQPEPDTSLPAEEREIGGLGIHFVRQMLDSHHYERCEGHNVVVLTKHC